MKKRQSVDREEVIRRKIEAGDGQGHFKDYRPWLNQYLMSSKGRTNELKGHTVERPYVFFSDLERDAFLLLDYEDQVIDIREQFPLLERKLTTQIAKELGIRHPVYPKTDIPVVMTSDFLVTIREDESLRDIVRTVKPREELEKDRVIEKFMIEKEYWRRKGITDYKVVMREDLPELKLENLSYVNDAWDLSGSCYLHGKSRVEQETIRKELIKMLEAGTLSPGECAKEIEDGYKLSKGAGIYLCKHLVARKILLVDLNTARGAWLKESRYVIKR